MNNNLTGKLLIGGILIFLGIGFLFDQFSIFNFGRVIGSLWPLFFIFIGLFLIIRNPSNVTPGIFFLVLGAIFQIDELNIFNFNIWNLWPLILIFVGVTILLGRGNNWSSSNTQSDEDLHSTAIFWGDERKVTSKNLKGGTATAIFGGIDLDLRDATLSKEGAKIEVSAIFGGVEIKAPKGVKVVNKGTGIFGAFENNASTDIDEGSPVLEINGAAIFGGVEIK